MKLMFSFLAVASALVSLVSAQGGVTGGVPSCAQPCVNEFTTGGGSQIAGCNRIDVACICSNKDFLTNIACCLVDKCSLQEQQQATEYALSFCKANQVTGLPTAVTCATANSTSASHTGAPTPTLGANTASTSTPASAASTNAAGLGAMILGGLVAAVVAML